MPESAERTRCPRCGGRGEPTQEGFAEYRCENGHTWLVGGPL